MNTNARITDTFPRAGKLLRREITSNRNVGILLRLRRGLRTRKVLSMDILYPVLMRSMRLARTTRKSIQFHASLKYAPLELIRPIASIFEAHSRVKASVKNSSVESTKELIEEYLLSVRFPIHAPVPVGLPSLSTTV